VANFVYLLSDEHTPFVAGPYGHPFVETPAMNRLADEGTVYENAYCPSPLCLPTRAAFFAGRRVHEIQAYNNCGACLPRDLPSFGGDLDRQSVHTVFVGKSDGYAPVGTMGFSEVIRGHDRSSMDANIGRRPLRLRADTAKRRDRYGPKPDAFRDDLERMDAALGWLRESAPSIDTPWVLCVNLVNPHFPHYVTDELWERYEGHDDLPLHGPDATPGQHPYAQDIKQYFATHTFEEEHVRGQRRGYYGCVTFIDQQIGRMLDALAELGLRDSTNFMYTSDHGEMLGEFGMWWKCSLYEPSARVPLIAAGPDFDAGVRVSTPVDLLDAQATLYSATGATRPDGRTGTPLPDVPTDDPTRTVFAEYHGHGMRASAFMVRRGRWKLIHYAEAPNQLFDLDADPHELDNLYEAQPSVAAEMEAELRAICSPEAENARADDFIVKQLAAVARGDIS